MDLLVGVEFTGFEYKVLFRNSGEVSEDYVLLSVVWEGLYLVCCALARNLAKNLHSLLEIVQSFIILLLFIRLNNKSYSQLPGDIGYFYFYQWLWTIQNILTDNYVFREPKLISEIIGKLANRHNNCP